MRDETAPLIDRRTGRFRDPALEAAYLEDSWPMQRLQIALTMGGFSLGLLAALHTDFTYLTGTQWFVPAAGLRGATGLLGLVTGLWMLVARPDWRARWPGLLARAWLIIGLTAALLVAFAYPTIESDPLSISNVLIFTAFWMCIFCIVIAVGLSRYVLTVTVFCAGMTAGFLALAAVYWDDGQFPKITQSIIVIMGAIFGVTMALVSNIASRRRFHITRLYEAARQAAQKSEEFQTFLLAAAGHDIRQPLYALDLNASTLEAMAERGELDQVRHLAQRQKAVARNLSVLLSAMLDLSSLHRERRSIEPQNCPVKDLLRDAADPLEALAADKGISLRKSPSRLGVHADQGILIHVVSNLVANAITHSGGSRILLGARRRGDQVLIIIADDGQGLSREAGEVRSIADLRHKPPQDRLHAGLGMEIMFALCERGGLELTITHKPGAGLMAVIACPAAPKEEGGR